MAIFENAAPLSLVWRLLRCWILAHLECPASGFLNEKKRRRRDFTFPQPTRQVGCKSLHLSQHRCRHLTMTNLDIRWKQRLGNFDQAFVLLREALEREPEGLKPTGKGRHHPAFRVHLRTGMEGTQDKMETTDSSSIRYPQGGGSPGLCRQIHRRCRNLDENDRRPQSDESYLRLPRNSRKSSDHTPKLPAAALADWHLGLLAEAVGE